MATLTATRAASTFPVFKGVGSGVCNVAWGTIALTSNNVATTIVELCRVPKGAVVVGGWAMADDLDTNGSEEMDIDIGWAANGVDSADPDGFGNFDVWIGDALADFRPVAGHWKPLQGVLLVTGPQAFSAETTIQAVINVDAATGGTGQLSIIVLYVVP